jgi:hypothetical protein
VHVPKTLSQVESLTQEPENDKVPSDEVSVVKRKRKKTSGVWNDFDEVEITKGVFKAICKYCKKPLAYDDKWSSTSHLIRHSDICMLKKAHRATEANQTVTQGDEEINLKIYIIFKVCSLIINLFLPLFTSYLKYAV